MSATKPKMNVRLLRRIQKQIAKEPRQFDMDWYFGGNEGSPCGTTCCIGGWAVTLSAGFDRPSDGENYSNKTGRHPRNNAMDAIGINDDQASVLFYCDFWPEPFCSEFDKASGPEERAKTAAARIDHFIKTKGAE